MSSQAYVKYLTNSYARALSLSTSVIFVGSASAARTLTDRRPTSMTSISTSARSLAPRVLVFFFMFSSPVFFLSPAAPAAKNGSIVSRTSVFPLAPTHDYAAASRGLPASAAGAKKRLCSRRGRTDAERTVWCKKRSRCRQVPRRRSGVSDLSAPGDLREGFTVTHSRGFAPHSVCPRQCRGQDRLQIFNLWLFTDNKISYYAGSCKVVGRKMWEGWMKNGIGLEAFLHPLLPLPLGEVSERSEDGEGRPRDCQAPLSRLRRQLSQRESQGVSQGKPFLSAKQPMSRGDMGCAGMRWVSFG